MKKRIVVILLVMGMLFASVMPAEAENGKVTIWGVLPSQWSDIAEQYHDATGTEVEILDGIKEAEALKRGKASLLRFDTYGLSANESKLMELSDTGLLDELAHSDFAWANKKGKIKAIGASFYPFGIGVNCSLLDKAGYSFEDIKDFASLKRIADDIHARSEELGFDAFVLTGASGWKMTGTMIGLIRQILAYEARDDAWTKIPKKIKWTYLEYLKNIYDLMLNDSTQASDLDYDHALALFDSEGAVFWPCEGSEYGSGTWWMTKKTKADMIPAYCGVPGEENFGLGIIISAYWGINLNP